MHNSRMKLLFIGVLVFSAIGCASVQELAKEGRLEEAEKHCQDPNDYGLVGEAYLKKGDDQGAINCFAKANDEYRLSELAEGYFKSGELDKAVLYYFKIASMAQDGMFSPAFLRLAAIGDAYFAKGALSQAAQYYAVAIDYGWGRMWGESKEATTRLADAFAARKDYENAVTWYKKAGYVTKVVYWRLGEISDANGDFQNAMVNFKKARDIEASERGGDPLAEWLRLRAEGYAAKEEYDKAADVFELLKNGHNLVELGRQRMAAGDIVFAASLFERAMQADPPYASNRQSLYTEVADAYMAKGDFAKAAEYYAKAPSTEGVIKAGDAAQAAGDTAGAVTYYRLAKADERLMRLALRSVKKANVVIEQEYYGKRRDLLKPEDMTRLLSYCGLKAAAPDDQDYDAVITMSIKGHPLSAHYSVYGTVYSGASVDVVMRFEAALNGEAVSYRATTFGLFSPPTTIGAISSTGPESAPFFKAVDDFLNRGAFDVLGSLFGGAPLTAALRDPKFPTDSKSSLAINVLKLRDNKLFDELLSCVKKGPSQTRDAVLDALRFASDVDYKTNVTKWKEWWDSGGRLWALR